MVVVGRIGDMVGKNCGVVVWCGCWCGSGDVLSEKYVVVVSGGDAKWLGN